MRNIRNIKKLSKIFRREKKFIDWKKIYRLY